MSDQGDELIAALQRIARGWPLGRGSVDPESWPGGGGGAAMLSGGIPPPASGRIDLSFADVSRPQPGRHEYQQVCTWRTSSAPWPVTLTVHVDAVSPPTPSDQFANEIVLPSLPSLSSVVPNGGVLRLVYGTGSALRVVEADLRSGSYQLPACETCEVLAATWGAGPYSLAVSAAVVPSAQGYAHGRLIASSAHVLVAPADDGPKTFSQPVPYGARWVSMGSSGTDPVMSLMQENGLEILHDYATPEYKNSSPLQPVELPNRDPVVVTNVGTATTLVWLRFYLET